MGRLKLIVWAAVVVLAAACQAGAQEQEPLSVFVSIQPQAYVAERIGKERVAVEVLVPPGKSPATYAPRPAQMTRLSRAALFFSIGVPFEQTLMPKIKGASQGLTLVDTTEGITPRRFANGGRDPHVWMSPLLVKQQAITVCNALCKAAPESGDYFRANLEHLLADLDRLDNSVAKALEPLAGETIFVFHPVFGYFADRYGLTQTAVEVAGKAPKGRALADFIKKARAARIRVIFVQPQFDTRTAHKIATAINGAVVPLDPLAKDYIANLTAMAHKIRKAFEQE
ncbi:MAG: zinc ABC transporter solute-binding protein [Desulfobacteraceae bacterium]|nr:zinc ABC transporter solute-binding protein [Desulfobacteraceae bacterium]